MRIIRRWLHKLLVPISTRSTATLTLLQPKRCKSFLTLKCCVVFMALILLVFAATINVDLNAHIFLSQRISHSKDAGRQTLHGCFDEFPKDSPYLSGTAEFIHDVSPGVSLVDGFECFDYAATIQNIPGTPISNEKTIYHTYWDASSSAMGPLQLSVLRSFFATQNTSSSVLYLWFHGDLPESPLIKELQQRTGDSFELHPYDREKLLNGTPMEGSSYLSLADSNSDLDADLMRLLVVYQHGGMWFDMDTLFVRDMSPLFDHEWLPQWNCIQSKQSLFSNTLMQFKKKSPYVCEMLADMAHSQAPRKGTSDWGSFMLSRVHHKLLSNQIRPWDVLPWCFTNPSGCESSNSMPGAFAEKKFSRYRLLQSFAYHWHHQRAKAPGSLFRFLDERHIQALAW